MSTIIRGGNCYRVRKGKAGYRVFMLGDTGKWADWLGEIYKSAKSARAAIAKATGGQP